MAKKKKESTQDKLVNLQAATLAAQVANWAAQLEFSKERFRLLEMPQFQQATQLEIDKFAWQKAQDTWERAFQESSMTGTYNGQPTIQWLTEQARLTGVLNGQETLEGKLTNAQITQMQQEMNLRNQQHLLEIGKFEWAKELEGKQLQLQTELQEASLTGYHGGKKTFEREQFEAEQGQKYLSLLSSLQGPSNAFKQLRVLQGGERTGMSSFADQWLGTYGQGQARSTGPMQESQGPGPDFQAPMPPSTVGPNGNVNLGPGPLPGMGPKGTNPSTAPGFDPLGGGSIMQQGTNALPAPALPTPATPAGGPIPGRGFDPSQWNDATRAAVEQWNAAHPGYVADGSQQGWAATDPGLANIPPGSLPSAGGMQGIAAPTPMPQMPAYQPGATYDPVSGLMVQEGPQLTPEQQQAAQYAGVTPEQYAVLGNLFSQNLKAQQPMTPQPGVTPGITPGYEAPSYLTGMGQKQTYLPTTPDLGYTTNQQSIDLGPSQIGTAKGTHVLGQQDPRVSMEPLNTSPAGESQRMTIDSSAYDLPQGPGYLLSDEGQQAPLDAYNYQFSQSGQEQVYPPGVKAPPDYRQISTNTPVTQAQARTMYSSLDPRQMNAKAYNASNPYAQKMAWAAFEDMGWDTEAAQGEFMASLPKYGGPTKGRITGGF